MKKLAVTGKGKMLGLSRETLHALDAREAAKVLGGSGATTVCDSICIQCTW
ncbi:MAG TPA: hypothetical protein VHG32_23780 [Thermoanaerobaculia bacterium]|jgi:hypothetical protein|nr:hypothetical protein [Thermoanaerobaculia bacterium]